MKILSHRGAWKTQAEHNSRSALKRALGAGWGIECDIRDCIGAIVVSHDPPAVAEHGCLALDELLKLAAATSGRAPLALNVKSDGLVGALAALRVHFPALDAFFFDMSVPEQRRYLAAGLPVFTRHSDLEATPVLYAQAAGVWLDELERPWVSAAVVEAHLAAGKRVCLVSPELHGREYLAAWDQYRRVERLQVASSPELLLCTDLPDHAAEFFAP